MAALLTVANGRDVLRANEQLQDYRTLQYQHDAALALLNLQEHRSCAIYGVGNAHKEELTQTLEWMGERAYSLGVLTVASAAPATEAHVRRAFHKINGFVGSHGKNGLVVFANGDALFGVNDHAPTKAQHIASRLLAGMLREVQRPKVCVLTETPEEEGLFQPKPRLLGQLASGVSFTGLAESPIVRKRTKTAALAA